MMHRKITAAELEELSIDDMTEADKQLINKAVAEFAEEPVKADAVRGYLVQLCEESILDDNLREDLLEDAASFSEGWDSALKFGGDQ